MPNIADRMIATIEKNKEAHSMTPRRPLRVTIPQVDENIAQGVDKDSPKHPSLKRVPTSVAEYSSRSQIAKAYQAGEMPFLHKHLFRAIKRELNGETEGEIILQNALDSSGIPRRSALNILKHMANFGVLVAEARYRHTWVKISPEWFSQE